MFDCDRAHSETCVERHVTDQNQNEARADCVHTPLERCEETIIDWSVVTRVCRGNVVAECAPVGYWIWLEDCSAKGLVCQNSEPGPECVPK